MSSTREKNQPPVNICVFCSNDLRIADWSAQLYKKGHGETLFFSGGIAHRDDMLNIGWNLPEVRVFAQGAFELGVPAPNIIEEIESKNSGENVSNGKAILEACDHRSKAIYAKTCIRYHCESMA